MTNNILIFFTRFTTERREGDEYFFGYNEDVKDDNWGWGIKDGSNQKGPIKIEAHMGFTVKSGTINVLKNSMVTRFRL